MRMQRGVAASFRVPMLLLGTALAWTAPGYARDTGHSGKANQGRSSGEVDIAPPDLPVAGVSINASDLDPGDDARRAMSRIVADPGSVLKAYAPLGRGKADQNTFPTSSIPLAPALGAAAPRHPIPGTVLRASLGASPASAPPLAAGSGQERSPAARLVLSAGRRRGPIGRGALRAGSRGSSFAGACAFWSRPRACRCGRGPDPGGRGGVAGAPSSAVGARGGVTISASRRVGGR